jgi:hypothetical protein
MTAQRTIVLVDLTNNPSSAPPVQLSALGSNLSIVTRGTAFNATAASPTLVFVGAGGSGTFTSYVASAALATAGLTLSTVNGVGVVTGTPNVQGLISFTVTVTDSNTNTATLNYSIFVNSRLALTHSPKNTEFGLAYSDSFTVSGNTGAVTYATKTLAGIALAAGGTLTSAASNSVGAFDFSTTATDAGTGDTLSIPFFLTVTPPFSIVQNLPSPVADSPYTGFFVVVNPWWPLFKLTSITGLPSWATATLTSSGSNGNGGAGGIGYVTISGTPPSSTYQTGSTAISITVQLTDALGKAVSSTWNGTVLNPHAIQPQQGGSPIGSSGFLTLNVTGGGATVGNTGPGGVMTITIPTGAGGIASLAVTSPIQTSGGTSPTISILTASGSQAGALSSADWTTFNNKLSAPASFPLSAIATSQTLVSDNNYEITASGQTFTLPASPVAGDQIGLFHIPGVTSTINPNGKPISGRTGPTAGNMTVDLAGARFTMTYADATRGWMIT